MSFTDCSPRASSLSISWVSKNLCYIFSPKMISMKIVSIDYLMFSEEFSDHGFMHDFIVMNDR